MAAEADSTRAILDEAWRRIPQVRDSAGTFGAFTRRRIERLISLVVALGSLVLGVQAFLAALAPGEEQGAWGEILPVLAFVPLTAMLIACVADRGVALWSTVFAGAYLVTLLLWPVATLGGTAEGGVQPWTWYLVSVATAAGILAFPLPLQIAWTALIPLVFGITRMIQGDFAVEYVVSVSLDISFSLIFGGVLVALAWAFRSVASGVDESRNRAVDSYAEVAAADAAEQERVAVAALMHDSVLAALIAAERAHTDRQRTLAVAMAREALTRLANAEHDAEEGPDIPRDAASVADDIERGARELGVDLNVDRVLEPGAPTIPGRVAGALVLAAMQAIANALQHAGGEGLAVAVENHDHPSMVRIAVHDDGAGFDLAQVPDDRLGIRASIIARMAAVGGVTDIESSSSGTTVRLEWQEPAE